MKPKTLEEALEVINQLTTQVTDLTEKNKTVIQEKKDAIELFKNKEGMTDTEKELATALETERAARLDLEKKIADENTARQNEANTRISTALEERIVKASKGDTAVAEKLRANVALLEKMPRGNDAEIDAVITGAWNMLGSKEANPLAQTNNTAGGAPAIDAKPNFAETAEGKGMAAKLGLTNVAKADEAGDK